MYRPPLQALTGELLSHDTSNSEDGACLDVSAQGYWGDRHHRAFFDVCVFHPNAPSYWKMQLPSAYRLHERQKQRSYDQRVREVEHGSFTPLVFSTSGGMGKCASVTYKRLASPECRAGNTLSSVKGIQMFEGVKYVSETVVQIAIEPKHPKDLPKLVDTLKQLTIEDPNLIVKIDQESGETIVAGMGVLHLDVAVHRIQDQKLEIITSEPLINYRETVKSSCEPVMSKSPNRHNKIFMKVEPLEPEIAHMLRTGEISDMKDKKFVAEKLKEAGWDTDTVKRVMKLDSRGNVLINGTKGVQFVQESTDSINSGFDDTMKEGPLCKEQMRNCKFIFTHFVPHEDTAHRGLSQLGPASRRACMGALLTAGTAVLEPTLAIEVRVPTDLVGNVATVISGKRGKVLDMVQKGASSIITGEIPASETFTLSEEMRGQTAGGATWNTSFKEWTEVPKSMLIAAVADIRKRKGLAPDPPGVSEFIDKD